MHIYRAAERKGILVVRRVLSKRQIHPSVSHHLLMDSAKAPPPSAPLLWDHWQNLQFLPVTVALGGKWKGLAYSRSRVEIKTSEAPEFGQSWKLSPRSRDSLEGFWTHPRS
jgi:hypothetical protein